MSTTHATCKCLQHSTQSTFVVSKGTKALRALPPKSRSSKSTAAVSPVVASAGFAVGGGAHGALNVSQVVNAVGCLLGAAFIGRELLTEQSSSSMEEDEDACPSCGGCGTETCMCRKWSDGDSGCGVCQDSGLMACRNCRGGGTKVPIRIQIHVEGDNAGGIREDN